jgi:GntR family transcriptional regulator / MocR family aminotransferase
MPKQDTFQDLVLGEMREGQDLWRWLYTEIRDAIADGRLRSGSRLPATRNIAEQYGISRGTVVAAFNQLKAEGYTTHSSSAGTYVRTTPRSGLSQTTKRMEYRADARNVISRTLAAYSDASLLPASHSIGVPFRCYEPAIDLFPVEQWTRVAARVLRNAPRSAYGQGDSAGYLPLRRAIAEYIGRSRGVRCTPDQIMVTAGTQQAVDFIARFLVQTGDKVWMEDPGYHRARRTMIAAGVGIVNVPVDSNGMIVATAIQKAPSAKLAYVTCSNQFPLGVTMSANRRMELLEWASRNRSWIVEDEYDAEYRYEGRPIASLQSLDRTGSVIYVGTFTKMLFNALRIGFIVLPESLVKPFVTARSFIDRHPPFMNQAILAEFISEGYFSQHVKKMRVAYAERLGVLCSEADKHLSELVEIQTPESGMRAVGWLCNGMSDKRAAQLAQEEGIETLPISMFSSEYRHPPGLMLGFAGCNPADIRRGVKILAKVLRPNHRATRRQTSKRQHSTAKVDV